MFTILCVIALLVFLLIAFQGGWAVNALIHGAIVALVIVLVAYLLLGVIGGGGFPALK